MKEWTLENDLNFKESIPEVIRLVQMSLIESVFLRQSLLIRFILKNVFKVNKKKVMHLDSLRCQ